MSKEKQERRAKAGPSMDPMAMSMKMSPLPGAPPGPGNMNGNPMNVTSLNPQLPSMDPAGMQESIYRDGMYRYPQMGAEVLNPAFVEHSGIQQNTPITPYGKNNTAPHGLQVQPPISQADDMEGMRQGMEAANRQLMATPYLGLTGMPAVDNPNKGMGMPGALAPNMPGTSGPPLEQLPPTTMYNGMTPGKSKVEYNKKRRGRK